MLILDLVEIQYKSKGIPDEVFVEQVQDEMNHKLNDCDETGSMNLAVDFRV